LAWHCPLWGFSYPAAKLGDIKSPPTGGLGGAGNDALRGQILKRSHLQSGDPHRLADGDPFDLKSG